VTGARRRAAAGRIELVPKIRGRSVRSFQCRKRACTVAQVVGSGAPQKESLGPNGREALVGVLSPLVAVSFPESTTLLRRLCAALQFFGSNAKYFS
jgi:hypothetical protein